MDADRPKMLGDPYARAHRLQQIRAPYVRTLNTFVGELREETGAGDGIPYFDPWDGGVEAEVLFLLEAPGPKAVRSGFISRNNPDETAKNFFKLCFDAGIDRKSTVFGASFLGTSAAEHEFERRLERTWYRAFVHFRDC